METFEVHVPCELLTYSSPPPHSPVHPPLPPPLPLGADVRGRDWWE